jgi:hypothetical protein
MKGLYDTYSYYTAKPEKPPEPQITAKFDDGGLKDKLSDVQNANLIRIDPSEEVIKKRNNIKNFDAMSYLFENHNPQTNSQYGNAMEGKDDFFLKTECCYLIKFEQVNGTLILKKECMVF